MPDDEPLKLAARPSKCTEDDEDDDVDDVDDVGIIVLPAAAAALSIESPGLNISAPSTTNKYFRDIAKRRKRKERIFIKFSDNIFIRVVFVCGV